MYHALYNNQFWVQRDTVHKDLFNFRLETQGEVFTCIFQKVYETGILNPEGRNDMLRAKFWSDLKDPELKNATRHTYDIIKNFDELRKEGNSVKVYH
jgi:hypothetical protein